MAPALRERIVGLIRKMSVTGTDTDMAEDVAQDTLLRLWMMRDRLDRYSSVEALAMVMARNRALDLLRHNSSLRHCEIGDADIGETVISAEEVMERREGEKRVISMMEHLPSGQQAVLRMRHVDGMEISEIAAITGSTANAIRVTLSRARQNIKEIYLKITHST